MRTPSNVVKLSVLYAIVVLSLAVGSFFPLVAGIWAVTVIFFWAASYFITGPEPKIEPLPAKVELTNDMLTAAETEAVKRTLLTVADAHGIGVRTLLLLYGGFKELPDYDAAVDELTRKCTFGSKKSNKCPATRVIGADSPEMEAVILEAFNTGKSVIGEVDDTGKFKMTRLGDDDEGSIKPK